MKQKKKRRKEEKKKRRKEKINNLINELERSLSKNS
jgi:non-homologous end joining protein Ku